VITVYRAWIMGGVLKWQGGHESVWRGGFWLG
jgi:hypothetical protein